MAGQPAGTLSISIVADIARLQTELDKAKRQVSAASGDIGRNAMTMNDNIARSYEKMGASVNRSAGAQKAGMQQLGMQLGDMATMYSLGAKPMQIFASQLGQVTQAVQLMAGGTSKFAAFLGGPWGTALSVGAIVLVPLISNLFETEDAAGAAGKEITALSQVFDFTKLSVEQLIQVQKLLNDELADTERTALQAANALRQTADANLRNARAAIADAQAQLARKNAIFDAAAAGGQIIPTGNMEALQSRIDAVTATLDGFEQLSRRGAFQANILTAAMSDQERQAERLRSGINNLQRQYEATGDANTLAAARRLQDQLDAVEAGPGRVARPRRVRAARQTDEEKATARQIEATKDYIETLEREIETMGLGEEAIRQLEVARQIAAATTTVEKGMIEALNIRRLEAITIMEREAETRRQLAEDERKSADMAEAASARKEAAMKREIDAARILNDQMQDLISSIGQSSKVGGAIGTLLGITSGNVTSIGGKLGEIFNIGTGSETNAKGEVVARTLGDEMRKVFKLDGDFGKTMTGLLKGAGIGSMAGSAILGKQTAVGQLGSSIGGALGQEAGKKLLSGVLGSAAGPLGAIAGGILGGVVGGLFKKSKSGSASISSLGDASLMGSNDGRKSGAGTLASSVQDSLAQLASALGAEVGAFKVTIGTYNDRFRVNTTGNSKVGGYKGSASENESKYGLYDFATEQEAIEFALKDALSDGAITGISEASKRILKSGQDLQKAIEKALLIESIPRLLKERLDPVGAALDTLDDKFGKLADALREGQATAQQYADAEKLYNLERQDVLEQMGSGVKTLKDYMKSLEVGSNSPLSLRSQYATASADLAKYEQTIRSGGLVDQDAFTEAAQALLAVSRQTNASGEAFFADFDRIRALTQQAVGNVESGAKAPGDGSVVFIQQTATNTASLAVMAEENNALLRQQNALLTAINDNAGGPAGNRAFLFAQRGFNIQ